MKIIILHVNLLYCMYIYYIACIFQGGIYIFQICDWYASVVSVLSFGIIECITICYIYGKIT